MAFQILSDISKQYLLEEDAIKGFRMAVENGQSRLALSILTDIIDVFNEIFVEVLSDDDQEEKKVEVVEPKNEKKVEPQAKAETKVEEKEPEQKPVVKKETKTTEEK